MKEKTLKETNEITGKVEDKKEKTLFTIITYSKDYIDDQETPELKHVFPHLTRKGVVGIMKLIMDNFQPDHVDIMREK